MADDQTEWEKLSLAERATHKVWKARVSAYQELSEKFSGMDDASLRDWIDIVKKIPTDSNLVAQETGLACLLVFLQQASSSLVAKTRPLVSTSVIEKCLSSTRSITRQRAGDIILEFIDAEVSSPIIEELLSATKAKQPKLVLASTSMLKDIIRLYGPKNVDIKPVMKSLSFLFSHSDQGVRSETTLLVVEIFKWTGKAVFDNILKDLKPVQIQEISELFEKTTDKGIQTRFLRSQQQNKLEDINGEHSEEVPNENHGDTIAKVENLEIDPLDLLEPVDVLAKIPANLNDALASAKWKDRKDALDELLPILDVPKYASGQYQPLVSTLSKKIGDVNILVAVAAVSCITKIAIGLKKQFASSKSIVLKNLYEKLKEKKANVVSSLRECLDAVGDSVQFKDIIEDSVEYLNNKNPSIRAEVAFFLTRKLASITEKPSKSDIKIIAETMIKLLDDQTPEVRDNAMQFLGTLMRVAGEPAISSFLDKVDAIKLGKIREIFSTVEVKAKGAPVVSVSYAKSTNLSSVQSLSTSSLVSDPFKKSKKPITSKANSISKTTKSSSLGNISTVKTSQNTKNATKTEKTVEAIVKNSYTDDFAQSMATEIFSVDLIQKLNDANWKTRLEGMEKFDQNITQLFSDDTSEWSSELFIRILKAQNVWKDSNFQVTSKLFEVIKSMCSQSLSKKKIMSHAGATLCVPILIDKIGDIKQRKPSFDCLIDIMEICGIGFVLNLCYEPLKIQKSPKNIAETLKAFRDFLLEFGIAGLDIRGLVDCIKFHINNSNAMVRGTCVSLLGTLRQYIGPEFRTLLNDINAAQLSTIDTEFEKLSSAPPLKPLREPKVTPNNALPSSESLEDSIFPRVDLAAALSPEVLENINNGNWKVRKESLDAVESFLSANKRIKSNIGEILGVLKARLNDSNKNLLIQTLEIIGSIATATGDNFEKHGKLIVPNILPAWNDNKIQVRQSVGKCLDMILTVSNLDIIANPLSQQLLADQPNLRKESFLWLEEKYQAAGQKFEKADLSCLINPTLVSLGDRSQEVRKAAQNFLSILVKRCKYNSVYSQGLELKCAASTMSLIESLKDESQQSVCPQSQVMQSPKISKKAISQSEDNLVKSSLSRPGTLKKKAPLSKAGSSVSVQESPPIEFPFLMNSQKSKDKRADQDRGMHKWSFDSPRKDLIEFLQEQMDGCIHPDLMTLLFSQDHHREKDYLTALGMMDDALKNLDKFTDIEREDAKDAICYNSDLILKYITIRLFDSNTSILLKCLEVIEHTVLTLEESSYQLSDYEAGLFLPYLINKVGDNKEVIRNKIRSILRQFCSIYPPVKLFMLLLNGTSSKNARTRAECLDEIGELIAKYESSVFNPSKCLPIIAAQIGDRDASVRNAAIQAVIQSYSVLGEQVTKYIGKLNEKDKSLLEEKMKRSKVTSTPSKKGSSNVTNESGFQESNPIDKEPAPDYIKGGPKRHFSLDLDELDLPTLSNAASLREIPPAVENMKEHVFKQTSSAASLNQTDYLMDFLLTQITSGDVFQSVDALKQLENQLQNDPNSTILHLNQIVNAITLQIRLAFSSQKLLPSDSFSFLRLLKHLINVLVQIFGNKDLANTLNKDTLHQMLTELVSRLVDHSVQSMGDSGVQLTRAFNVLMLKILENCNKNHVFSVLLDLLDAGVAAINYATDEDLRFRTKFTELIMKCLWKITKTLRDTIKDGNIDVSHLYLDIHKFLTTNPSSEWKIRAAEDKPLGDMPLRTVKTILHETAVEKGIESLNIMDTVAIEEPRRSAVYQYLKHMVDGGLASNQTTVSPSIENGRGISIPTPLSNEEIKYAVEQIFNKISSKTETKQGLIELHNFQKTHPNAQSEIDTKLSTFGVNFRLYILKSLEKIAEENGDQPIEYRTASTMDNSIGNGNSKIPDEAEDYKERLMKLQQMFGYDKQVEATPATGGNNNGLDEVERNGVDESKQLKKESSVKTLPSVLALKERLERMKSSMASLE